MNGLRSGSSTASSVTEKTRMRVVVVCVVAVVSMLVATVGVSQRNADAASKPPAKKLIEVGWDAPFPDRVRSNIKQMEKSPFAGTMINLHAGKTILNKKPYAADAFVQDVADLQAVSSKSFNQNFITMWSAREQGWSWFDDQHWAAAETNARNFARAAAASKIVRGLMFDPEPYGTNPWSYSKALYPDKSISEVQAQVRKRGASFMSTVQREKPDIEILMLFGPAIVLAQVQEKGSIEKAEWGLWASFIDGMLDVIGPKARLIEGNEGAYYYVTPSDFDWFSSFAKESRSVVSEKNRTTFDRQMETGSAVFADGLLNTLNSPRFFGFYLKTDEERLAMIESHTFNAFRTSNKYVWVYNEEMDWWGTFGKGVTVPRGLADALRAAQIDDPVKRSQRAKAQPAVERAKALYEAKVEIDGQVVLNGSGLAGVELVTEFRVPNRDDMACQYSQAEGYFQCFFPPNYVGRITPKLDGYTFDPPFFLADKVSKPIYDVKFNARKK
jgi:hypothetical protein